MSNANFILSDAKTYHLGCGPGDVAEKILLVGDAARAQKAAALFETIRFTHQHREYHTYTGIFQGHPMTVMSTGMGEGCMEIAVIELAHITDQPTLIRAGSCSALDKTIGLGELIITEKALDMGAVLGSYAVDRQHLQADPDVLQALQQAAQAKNIAAHTGLTASAPGFYGPQGRHLTNFPLANEQAIEPLFDQNVQNLEMEVATLLGLCALGGLRAGAVCAAYGHRYTNEFLSTQGMALAEKQCLDVSLHALTML